MSRVIASGRFILGPELEAFEREFAAAQGARFAVGVANGTEALELILRARGIGPGAEVIVPALTSPFTALAVLAAGATPVFADVDPETLLLDPKRIPPRARAVIPVHLYGRVAPSFDGEIIQDAAQAHGAPLQFRHPAAFSFYPTKNLGALGDGGAVLTDDEDLAACLRLLRHGGQKEFGVVTTAGINSRLDELQAAILRALLPHLEESNRRRRELARRYARIRPPVGGICDEHVFHLYVIRSHDRDRLRARWTAAGVETAIHYPVPLHQLPLFRSTVSLPVAEQACREILSVPLNPEMTEEEIAAVCELLHESI